VHVENSLLYTIAGIGDLDDFGSLSAVPATVKVSTSKKQADKPRITVMYACLSFTDYC